MSTAERIPIQRRCQRCGTSYPAAIMKVIDEELAKCVPSLAREHMLPLAEEDRQLVLMALAALSLDCPGFDDALNRVALRIDNNEAGRAGMYDAFRVTRARALREVRRGG